MKLKSLLFGSITALVVTGAQAAEQGLAKAQFNLGHMYENGRGVTQDDSEAVTWYHKAAEQGDAQAQHNLGNMYRLGRGVSQDYTEAVKWYGKAAEQGDFGSQYNLAGMYETGLSVPKDYVLSYMWYNLAAAQAPALAGDRDELAKQMTPDQITEAQRMAREWMEKHQQ